MGKEGISEQMLIDAMNRDKRYPKREISSVFWDLRDLCVQGELSEEKFLEALDRV